MVLPTGIVTTLWWCEGCTAEYTSPEAAAACEDQHDRDERTWRDGA